MSPDIRAPKWKVEYQNPTIGLGPDGRAQEGYQVGFATEAGHHGSVFIPRTLYTPANVAAAVADHAMQLDQVGKLTG